MKHGIVFTPPDPATLAEWSRQMMQEWADYLDKLKASVKGVELPKRA